MVGREAGPKEGRGEILGGYEVVMAPDSGEWCLQAGFKVWLAYWPKYTA
jgi:hypothetical protein